ncbi:MAG: polyphosphate--glucose phosphotransferase [Pseudomonadota bacterium]
MNGAVIGVDVGGSSIKYARVDVQSGRLLTPLASVVTPHPGTAQQLIDSVAGIAPVAGCAAVGVALPSVVRNGIALTAANLDATLIGCNIQQQLQQRIGAHIVCINDADAAGLAEMHFGAARGVRGTVMMLTFGTGIGSALFIDGHLVPNTELGHLQVGGVEAEHRASARVRTEEALDWAQWSARVNEYIDVIHGLFWPELIVFGGGVSEHFDQFGPLLRSPAQLRPALLGAAAGTVGAALAAGLPANVVQVS